MNALSSQLHTLQGFSRARFIEESDIVVLHVIGLDAIELAKTLADQGMRYIVIQYCGCWDKSNLGIWSDLWSNALLVWSYCDLSQHVPSSTPFYHAPLGVDDVFTTTPNLHIRSSRILTSGYVSGRPQEPIEDVWIAAGESAIDAYHLGPAKVSGMSPEAVEYLSDPSSSLTWKYYHQLDDVSLAHLYSSCKWISAMRYQEGFELPAIEGLVRGARPICFDQPSIRHWYGDLVHYVPECDGVELIEHLCGIFLDEYRAVTQAEIDYVRHRFDWRPIVNGFWKMMMETCR
jgi:hypothetical protein